MSRKNKEKRVAIWTIGIVMLFTILFFVMAIPNDYEAEQERFEKVLEKASDEERFLMLRYAMYNQYVPTHDIDPYENAKMRITTWYRTVMIYNSLSGRGDLLSQIYPDTSELRHYVEEPYYHSCRHFFLDKNNVDSNALAYDEMKTNIDSTLAIDRELFLLMDKLRSPELFLLNSYLLDKINLLDKYFGHGCLIQNILI